MHLVNVTTVSGLGSVFCRCCVCLKNIKKSYNNCLTHREGWRFMADVGESVVFISCFLLRHFDVNENVSKILEYAQWSSTEQKKKRQSVMYI